jgi:ketosteroid isomerase-like protein
MTRAEVESWIAAYEAAWRSAGVESLRTLFVDSASYRMAPYEAPVTGLPAIGELWEREREGADEAFAMSHEIVAVEGDTAVVRVEVKYGRGAEYRELWIVRLAADGRCREFEEWPFWPGQPLADDAGKGA